MTEETGKALILEIMNLSSEMAKFNSLFCHIKDKEKAEDDVKEQSEKFINSYKKHFVQ